MPLLIIALSALVATTTNAPAAIPKGGTEQSINQINSEPKDRLRGMGDPEPVKTPAQKAAQDAYQTCLRSLVQSLGASASARDRALGTQMYFIIDYFDSHQPTLEDRAAHGAMLRSAAEAAPDDALVQWLWANANPDDSGCSASHPCPNRAEAIARLQPGNGSAWLPLFNASWKAKDIPAAESALRQMSLANRYEEQIGLELIAWMDVFRRHPMPISAMDQNGPDALLDDQSRSFSFSMSLAAAFAIPAYQPLVDACNHEKHPDASASRFHDCAQLGRVMLRHSTSLIGRMISLPLLRLSGQATAADIANARVFDWQYDHTQALAANENADLKATIADWLATGDESVVLERQLQRAGIALTPPAAWQVHGRDGKPISPLGESPRSAKQL